MNKEYKQSGPEYSTPSYLEVPKENISIGSEFSEPSQEYLSNPDEYHETGHSESGQQAKKTHKNKLVYLIASAAACFTIFTVALDPKEETLFPDFGNDYYEDQIGKDEPGKDEPGKGDSDIPPSDTSSSETLPGNSQTEGSEDSPNNTPNENERPSTTIFAGKMFHMNVSIFSSNNYLFTYQDYHNNTYGLADYDGNILFSDTYNQTLGHITGPNDMGYTTFYHWDANREVIEIRDSKGEVVFSTIERDRDKVRLGDCDILYQELEDENGQNYITYSKMDGFVLFDSRDYAEYWATGYPFQDGHALIELTPSQVDLPAKLILLSYSGFEEEIPNPLTWRADIIDTVDEYFVAETVITQNMYKQEYSLVETATGKLIGTLDFTATMEELNLTRGSLSRLTVDGETYYHYGTYGFIDNRYIFDFRDIGNDGIPRNVVDLKNKTVYFAPRDYLVCEDPSKEDCYYYIDWEGNRVSPYYNGASSFNDEGYALVSVHGETNEIHVIDDHFNVVETLPGRIEFSQYSGDIVNIEFEGPEGYTDYYYGKLKEPKTTYTP